VPPSSMRPARRSPRQPARAARSSSSATAAAPPRPNISPPSSSTACPQGSGALAAVALTTDTSALTAIGNDRGFDVVFSRQIEALGSSGDVVLALTTSGASANVLEGLKAARSKGLVTIALTGENGGQAASLADHTARCAVRSTPRIQEAHLFILHILAGRMETGSGEPGKET